jgi:hypothetical protein
VTKPAHSPRAAILFTLLVLTVTGCTQIRVKSEFDPQANFAGLQTYAWLPDLEPTTDPRLDSKLLDRRVRAAVDRELAAKGYRQVEDDTAGFLVAYHVFMRRQTQAVREPIGPYSYRWWGGMGPTYSYQYNEGTLAVDVIDPAANALMWRGAATAIIDPRASVQERSERVDRAIKSLLEKFPPPPK